MLIIHLLLTSVILSSDAQSSGCSADLTVQARTRSVDVSNTGMLPPEVFQVTIRNRGTETVTLVEPGDGSEVGWRTPILTWQVELVGAVHASPPYVRCGNINVLRPQEVFDLKPGESHVLTHLVPAVRVTRSGTYKLRLRYENNPLLKWSGVPLAQHDPDAMQRVRQSTPCIAVSDQAVVTVTGIQTKRAK